jgi:hypothetical protein
MGLKVLKMSVPARIDTVNKLYVLTLAESFSGHRNGGIQR